MRATHDINASLRRFRSFWAITIFILLVLSSVFIIVAPCRVSAAQEGDYTYTLGGIPTVATITRYTGAGGAIAIPSSLGGYTVAAVGNYAFSNLTGLTSVTIPDCVTSIGDYAFEWCSSMTSVAIGSGVRTIGVGAFYASGLLSVTIGSSVTAIGNLAFSYCMYLTSVTIPNSVTSVGDHAFSTCIYLTSINIPDSVTSIGIGVFDSCMSLYAIDVSAGNADYASIDGVLYDKAITTLIKYPGGRAGASTIPSSVTSIGDWAFSYCISLTSVTIPNGTTFIGDFAFESCLSLASIAIPNSTIFLGNQSFESCKNLIDVTIGSNVTTIGEFAFRDCTSLTSMTFLGLIAPTVGSNWIDYTPDSLRGHAYAASNFPGPGGVFHELKMGEVVPGGPAPVKPDGAEMGWILAVLVAVAVVFVAVLVMMRGSKGER